jgi:NTP pyrophosphatase (non-canonical NTP hydrolase)
MSILAKLALVHSEVSEAVECARCGLLEWYEEDGKPEGMVVELADAVIRIADLCEALGLDLESAIELKHEYNKTRSHRHGGKLA